MIRTVILNLAQQRLSSPMRLLLVITCFGFGMMGVLFGGNIEALNRSQMGLFGMIMAAGLVGQEVSSGVLTLAFARPLQRMQWVVGRWLGASLLATVFVLLEVIVACAVATARHGAPPMVTVAVMTLEGILAVFGTSAVLLMLSSFIPGLGDLAILAMGAVISGVLPTIANHYHLGWLARAGDEMSRFLTANVTLTPLLRAAPVSWFEIASYVSTIAICIVVAVWAVNRKELSYASG